MASVNPRNIVRFCAFVALVFFCLYAGDPSEGRRRRGRKSSKSKSKARKHRERASGGIPPILSRFNLTELNKNTASSIGGVRRIKPSRPKMVDWTEARVSFHPHGPRMTSKHRTVGKFGYHSVQKNVVGRVVHVKDANRNSHLGCNSEMGNQDQIPTDEPWIALIRRGKCYFFNKIKLAEMYNASAAVIYDNEHGALQVMNTAGTHTVALMVNQRFGERLADLVDKGVKVYMNITIGDHHPVPTPNTPTSSSIPPSHSAASRILTTSAASLRLPASRILTTSAASLRLPASRILTTSAASQTSISLLVLFLALLLGLMSSRDVIDNR